MELRFEPSSGREVEGAGGEVEDARPEEVVEDHVLRPGRHGRAVTQSAREGEPPHPARLPPEFPHPKGGAVAGEGDERVAHTLKTQRSERGTRAMADPTIKTPTHTHEHTPVKKRIYKYPLGSGQGGQSYGIPREMPSLASSADGV